MWWNGRGNSGGSWLPEEKKANMWPGRGNSGGSWPSAFPRSLHYIEPKLFSHINLRLRYCERCLSLSSDNKYVDRFSLSLCVLVDIIYSVQ